MKWYAQETTTLSATQSRYENSNTIQQWMPMKKKKEHIPINSDLILYQTEDGKTKIEVRLEDETVWLSQQTGIKVNERTKNIF